VIRRGQEMEHPKPTPRLVSRAEFQASLKESNGKKMVMIPLKPLECQTPAY
jgi:hypothetical protein